MSSKRKSTSPLMIFAILFVVAVIGYLVFFGDKSAVASSSSSVEAVAASEGVLKASLPR